MIRWNRASATEKVRLGVISILQLIAVTSLITPARGRYIEDLAKPTKSRNIGGNEIDDSPSRGWYPNQAKNSEDRDPRLSELQWSTYSVREPNGFGTFAFGYDNVVDSAGNEHYRSEERFDNGTVIGEYGFTDHSIKRKIRVTYIADNRGYRAKTEMLPMEDHFSRETISRIRN